MIIFALINKIIGVNYNNSSIRFRKYNYNVPVYAKKIDKNTYVWRDVVKSRNFSSDETLDYVFANNSFYINKIVNFILKDRILMVIMVFMQRVRGLMICQEV